MSAAASSSTACVPVDIAAAVPISPKGGARPSRPRNRKKTAGRVHWDEQVIEEHNKERGTRQKIDEPDTPFVRSPQTASDSEGGPASSDDEHKLSYRASPKAGPSTAAPPPLQQEQGQIGDVDPLALASRLDNWVRSGGNRRRPSTTSSAASSDGLEADVEYSRVSSGCSSRSSSSAPPHRHPPPEGLPEHGVKANRRISLSVDDAVQPKPTSDSFRAKRAQHYNEVAALRAFKFNASGESSPVSDTSDEQGETMTKTNTNTNINQTVSKSLEARPRHSSSGSEMGLREALSSEMGMREALGEREENASRTPEGAGSRTPERAGARQTASTPPEVRDRTVNFSGESGGESSEEFRNLRNNHYSHEWRRDPDLSLTISSLETNTNTNLNAVSRAGVCRKSEGRRAKNPMEACRPPVQFDAQTGDTASSSDFRARRNQHYDEVKAVSRFKSESRDELEQDRESSDEALQEGEVIVNPANPMEPREAHVAFQVGGSPNAAEGSDGQQDGHSPNTAAVWRARRQAHYSEMAAALRSMPPPSDDEEDDDEAK